MESAKKHFYITTTLPYVNADPHVGFATELIRADAVARVKKLQGYEVFFNTGTDEHGQKLYDAALKEGKSVQTYVDGYAEQFKGLKDLLHISNDVHFIRTTDPKHEKAAQEFWNRCFQNGYIYKKNYQAKYCVGCELEKTDSELVDGKCPIHPNKELELIEEENYFFKFSEFGEKLLSFYESHPNFVIPDFRFNEIKSFVSRGLQDFSISRQKSKMSWGVPVPGDEEHVMYVWFDALVNYISTLGWPTDEDAFDIYWRNGTPIQYCGKDNLRQQSAMWQAMLMAAHLPNTHQIVIDGFLTGEGGVKMSKSLGNVVNPYDVVKEYGTDALRFFCLSELSAFEDSPFTMERFKEAYNAKLANGIGNLTSRIMKMAEANLVGPVDVSGVQIPDTFFDICAEYDFVKVSQFVWSRIQSLDLFIQEKKPFSVIKTDKETGVVLIQELVIALYSVALMLQPLLPDTSKKIKECVKQNKMPVEPLFLRKE
ncbi:MAG: methionine--tRNA ligase [Candidatus Taylorbacteria bacterium]|nr:methionine--tRNA ligase [Candidatus Taylorbacteria bacterium]